MRRRQRRVPFARTCERVEVRYRNFVSRAPRPAQLPFHCPEQSGAGTRYAEDVWVSPAARVLVRPFRGYDELARATPDEAPTVVGGALRLLFVIGATVALTATGRLAPIELVVAMVSFAYVPVIQLLSVALALRVSSPTTPLTRAFAMHLVGRGPWLVVMLVLSTICLLVPSPASVLFAVAPGLVLFAFGWASVLTYACFRRGLGLARTRAAVATGLYTLSLTALVVAYFLGMGQLGPLLRK